MHVPTTTASPTVALVLTSPVMNNLGVSGVRPPGVPVFASAISLIMEGRKH